MQQFILEVPAANPMGTLMIPILMIVFFYFFLMRPQKKKDKEAQTMRNNMEVGDEIVTIGGILGRVVSVREDNVLIESGSANTKLRITKTAVQANVSANERVQLRKQEAAAQAQKAKEEQAAAKAAAKAGIKDEQKAFAQTEEKKELK